MSLRKTCFGAILRDDTQVVVLGSLPGERSLAERRYYAHPRNRFWHLMGTVIDIDLASLEYPDRLEALLDAGGGLWDTVASARRNGSLDASIREADHNPLRQLPDNLPSLRAVGFNGRTAQKIGAPQLAGAGIALVPLPSSSPAHAAMSLAEKERQWGELRKYLR